MNKSILFYLISLCICAALFFGFYFDGKNFDDDYDVSVPAQVRYASDIPLSGPSGFGSSHAVVPAGTNLNDSLFADNTYAAILVDNESGECLVAHNPHSRIYPASMTKLVTAMVVCDEIAKGNLSLDDEITIDHKIIFNESGVMASKLDAGCKITVRNLMYGLLMKSYNDYAVILAEHISGSVENFAVLMNQKANAIGATNSHFVNPHGLHDDEHYVTAYDMYLIVNEAYKYDLIREIDSYRSFTYTYLDAAGNPVQVDITPTNAFLADRVTLPSNITIKTWKTGTTHMAGRCLAMVIEIDDRDYTVMVADSVSSEDLYNNVSMMFNLTNQ